MTLPRLRGKIFGRRSVRARIAVACAGLFLIIAAAFTAALYTVVDRSFGPTPPPSSIPAGLARTCQTAEANGTLKLDPALMTQCQYFLGAANQRTHDLHQLLLWSLAGLGVATIVAGISGWAIGRRILLPLHTITTAARRASRERLDERISLDGPADELKELADTFDDMLNRLDLAFASQRRFVANASHELRTPLTSMRTLIDVAMAKPTRTTGQLEVLAGRVREALDQSDALIDGLLTLARSDRGLTTRELVDLEAAAQDAIDHASTAARTSDIVIDADLSPAPTLGDRVLLERLVANLLDNAVHYNLTGGSVRVVTGSDDDVSYITVTNSGPLVPESAVTSLFEPFTRLEGRVSNSRGVGLGLSIVTSVVNAHHGHLDAEALPDGGMKISARLPKTTVGTSTDDIGQPVKDRIPPSMNTRSKSSLPTATTLSANPAAVVRHKPREGSVCRQLSFPTRWSAILADLWPASPEPAILPRGPSPPDPHAAGWGWSFSLCRARSLGRDAVVLGGHGPGRQPLRRRQPPRTPGAGLHQDQHPHHQQRDAAGAPATPHPRLHQCRPVTDYSCHRPDATAIGQFFEAIPHLAEHAKIACGNAEALFRLAWSQPPTLPPAGAARTPNPDDCGRPSSGHTERSDLRPT